MSTLSDRSSSKIRWAWFVGLVVLAVLPYVRSFEAPFFFDDLGIIDQNTFMRSLWPIGEAMEAPRRSTAAGRPIVAYSYAINYAISGLDVWSYHAFNLAVHAINALMVFVLLRFVLQRLRLGAGVSPRAATGLAWLITGLWAVHPLNSETVIYVAQRTESLKSMFMLAAFVILVAGTRRETAPAPEAAGTSEDSSPASPPSSSLATQLGVVVMVVFATLCKESGVMAVPLLLLFDRAFVAGSFGAAFRRRKWMYLGLLLPILVGIGIGRGDHRGGLATGDPELAWRYLLTQGGVLLHYLRLSVVPYPLAITYDWPLVDGLADSLPSSAIIFALLMASFVALVKSPKLGFAGMWFFLILAPTSTIIPIMSEVVGERRMYMPLLPVLVLLVVGTWRLLASPRWGVAGEQLPPRFGMVVGFLTCAILIGSAATFTRSLDFREELGLWEQTVRVQPTSLKARNNLAASLMRKKRHDEAERWFREVLAENPDHPRARHGLGMVYFEQERYKQAADSFLAEAHAPNGKASDFAYAGLSLAMLERYDAAGHAIQNALRLNPQDTHAINAAAIILDRQGRTEEALEAYRYNIDLYPESAMSRSNYAHSLDKLGRDDEARQQYETAHALFPQSATILNNYANFEASRRQYAVALPLFRKLVAMSPNNPEARLKLGICLARLEQDEEAEAYFQQTVTLYPEYIPGYLRYAEWLIDRGRWPTAKRVVDRGLQFAPEEIDLINTMRVIDAELRGENSPSTTAPTGPARSEEAAADSARG